MRIGGFTPTSFCDYPGHVTAVVFTQGCNFRCPFCHNAALLSDESEGRYTEHDILQRFAARRDLVKAVVVTGGEPTLQEDLADFLAAVKKLGLIVKLDTNGSRPDVLARLFAARLADAVAMDIKAPWPHYAALSGVAADTAALRESMQLIAQSGLPHLFRTTFVPALLTSADLEAIRAALPKGSPHVVQTFRPEHTLAPWLRAPHALLRSGAAHDALSAR